MTHNEILYMLVYAIVWLVIVFGINSVSNGGRKIVIVRGTAKHYCRFHACIASTINSDTTAKHTIID